MKKTIVAALLLLAPAAKAQGTAAISGAASPTLFGVGAPSGNAFLCSATAPALTGYVYIDTNPNAGATGGRIWMCDASAAGVLGWDHLASAVATAMTPAISAVSLLLGGCTSTSVSVPGATVGMNSAIASPLSQPTTSAATAGLTNTVAWVSAANTVTVSVCALGALTTSSVQYKVLMF